MARKLIQLKDGDDDCTPKLSSGEGTIYFTSSTSLEKVGTINMPSGHKLLRVKLIYSNASPNQLMLTDRDPYEKHGNVSANSSVTCESLSLTTITEATSESVFAKYNASNANYFNYVWFLLSD